MTAQKEVEDELRASGYRHVFTWIDPPNTYYPPHMHPTRTTHVILQGRMTVGYPYKPDRAPETYGVGERMNVEGGMSHEVWAGPDGCTYVIGEGDVRKDQRPDLADK